MFLKNEFLCLLLIYRLLSHQLHKVSHFYVSLKPLQFLLFISFSIDFIYTRNVNFKLQVIDYVVGDYTLVLVENSISIHLFFFNSWLLTEDIAVFIPFCSCRAFAIIIQHSCYFILCLHVTFLSTLSASIIIPSVHYLLSFIILPFSFLLVSLMLYFFFTLRQFSFVLICCC